MILFRVFIFLIATLIASQAFAEEMNGKVIGVTDGDTLTVMTTDHAKHKIRLAEIDTPEKGQPFGQKSREALSQIVFGKEARVEKVDMDRYGRIVGKVYVEQDGNEINVNKTMVASGAAWVYREYMEDESLLEIEALAKNERRGLWNLPEADRMPPWEWRKRSQEEINKAAISERAPVSTDKFSCGSKRYCKEMGSCDEARFYLTECNLSRLDGDGDGVPCEKICR